MEMITPVFINELKNKQELVMKKRIIAIIAIAILAAGAVFVVAQKATDHHFGGRGRGFGRGHGMMLQALNLTDDQKAKVKSIMDFDDFYTARLFGFGTAANYFATQSSNQFLEHIRVPVLALIAKDDPMVPFRVYEHPAFGRNPMLGLRPVEHGGHLGFISRSGPRFWLDETVLDWMEQQRG